MEKKKLLLVDDIPENLHLLYQCLKNDYVLYSATNGSKALELAGSIRPDMILLDIMMPEMDGFEVCRALKRSEELREIPVIFLTAMSDEADEVLGFELGAVDYITKPFKPVVVKHRVGLHLRLERKRDELLQRNRELEESLAKIKVLSGLLPICMYCKKIRKDKEIWQRLEEYITEHSDATFSHGMCPDCFDKHMADLNHMFHDEKK